MVEREGVAIPHLEAENAHWVGTFAEQIYFRVVGFRNIAADAVYDEIGRYGALILA